MKDTESFQINKVKPTRKRPYFTLLALTKTITGN
jgi:hypothetical protein